MSKPDREYQGADPVVGAGNSRLGYESNQIRTSAFFSRVSTATNPKTLLLRETASQSPSQAAWVYFNSKMISETRLMLLFASPRSRSRSTHPSTLSLLLFQLFDELHKPLLMHHPGKLTIPQHAHVPQPQLHKTLIHQIHR